MHSSAPTHFSHRAVMAAIATLAILLSAVSADALTVAAKGSPRCVIVTADNPSAPEKTAANELRDHLRKVTGGGFRIVTESQAKSTSHNILVGSTRRARQVIPETDWKSFGHDGIVLKTVGNDLILAGGTPRGTLYAVYTFLEDTVGCRWWTSTESFIPHKPTLEVPDLDIHYSPKLMYREAYYRDPLEDPKLAARLKLNGHMYRIPPEYGGHYSIIGWCHTFYQWLPPSKYFAEHPEWYSEVGGKRTASGAQLCLTNDEMRREFTKVVIDQIRKNPDAGIISVSQNDCGGRCECPKCRAVEAEEGSPSGPLIRFVNAVAADVHKEFPDVLVETLAYQYTRKPPLHVKPRKNVVVRLCTIECSFSQPLDSEENKSFRDDIKGWSAIAPNLYIWNYVTDFANYIQPHPNMRGLAPDLRFFVKNNAIGVFEQGDCACSIGDFVRLRAWVLGHLLWDPSRDERALVQEFVKGYYGPAAPYISAYLDLVHNAVERKGMRLGCYNGDLSFLTIDDMTKAADLFSNAEKAVAGDPVIARRIRRDRLPLDYTWLVRYDDLKRQAETASIPFSGPGDPRSAVKDFIKTAEEWDPRNFSEGLPFEACKSMLKSRFRPPTPPPEAFTDLPKAECIDIQDNKFQLFNPPSWAKIVDDSKASDGKAARMAGNHTQWAVQYHIDGDAAASMPGEWVCYVIARCKASAPSGSAFLIGIYDQKAGREVMRTSDSIEHAGDGKYHAYDLGPHSFKDGMYVWIAPVANKAVTGVYVDRVIFVREKGGDG